MPSYQFTHWHFLHHRHLYTRTHLSHLYAGQYNRYRHHNSGWSHAIGNWERENRSNLPSYWASRYGGAAWFNDYGRFEERYEKFRERNPGTHVNREQFLSHNSDSYKSMHRPAVTTPPSGTQARDKTMQQTKPSPQATPRPTPRPEPRTRPQIKPDLTRPPVQQPRTRPQPREMQPTLQRTKPTVRTPQQATPSRSTYTQRQRAVEFHSRNWRKPPEAVRPSTKPSQQQSRSTNTGRQRER